VTEALAALLGALVGGAASVLGTWFLDRRRSSRDAAAHLYREVIPFLLRELEIGPTDIPGRTVELVGREFSVHGEHPREAFGHAVDSLDRWSVLTGPELAAKTDHFVRQAADRRDFIESYDGSSTSSAPERAIFDDPEYRALTGRARAMLKDIDDLARSRARRR